MVSDPGENNDVSSEHPRIYQELLSEWEKYVADAKVFWPPPQRPPRKAEEVKRIDAPAIEKRAPRESIGGDPIEQCTAWMIVGEGEIAAPTLPSYTHILA